MERLPGLSAAFSSFERLGLQIPDVFLDSENFPDVFTNEELTSPGSDITLVVNGRYQGNTFAPDWRQNLRVYGEAGDLTIRNLTTGEEVHTTAEDDGGGTLLVDTDHPTLQAWLSGLSLEWRLNAAPSDEEATFNLQFQGEYALVNVTYEYDPILLEADALLRHDTLRGPVDTLVRSPLPFHVLELKVPYRTSAGNWVDTDLARREILNTVRGTLFPDVFDDSLITDSLLYAGASSAGKVTRVGELLLTLAHGYTLDGRDPDLSQDTIINAEGFGGQEYTRSVILNNQTLDPDAAVKVDNTPYAQRSGTRNVQTLLRDEALLILENLRGGGG
jgi:hypothetical protein